MRINKLQSGTALAIIMSAGLLDPVQAQEGDGQSGASGLEQIVVTAQRVEQNLQDVPVSLTVVDGSELGERNINELTQLALAAPTLQVGQDNTFAIRGIGSQIFAETVDPSVALAVDGVSLARNAMAGQPFNDVAAIEVLNGPQGLLFGKNASAGLVNITTQKPILGEYSGFAGSEFVIRDTTPEDATGYVLKGTANLPLGERSALRVNALYSFQDSIIENVFDNSGVRTDLDQERWGLKAKYLFENGPLSLYFIGDYNETGGVGGRFGRTLRSIDPASALTAAVGANGIIAGPENLTNDSDGEMFRDEKTGGLQGTVEYEFDNGLQLINIAAWRFFEGDQNLHNDFHSREDIVDNPNFNEIDQFSNELRFVLPGNESFSGQFGLYYYNFASDITNSLDVAGPPPFIAVGFPFCVGAVVSPGPPPNCPVSNDVFLGNDSDTSLETESIAAFGQFDFYLTDRFTATLGARVTHDTVSSTVTQGVRNYFVNIGGPSGTFSEEVENTNLSWKVGGQYDVSEGVMVYASAGQGYKAPGFNTENQNNPAIPFAVEDEISTTIEAGVRSQFWDDRVTLNVSVFNTQFDDYQAQSFNLDAQAFIIQNAATVKSQGAEVSLSALLSDNFSLYWDVALLDSTFDEFAQASCTPDAPLCAPGDSFYDASGQATPLAADVTSTLQGIYRRPLTPDLEGFIQGSVYYRSDMNFNVASPLTRLDSITTLNLSLGLETVGGLRFAVFCKNCGDEKVPTGIAFDPGENNDGFATTNQTWGLDSVRTIGIDISKSF